MNTYFITDAHLGSGDDTLRRERDLVAWLRSIEADARRVVMLGDIFDFWFTYRHAVPRGCVRLLGQMADMADRGVEFHFFIGNHDMWLFDYLEKEIGVVMHDEPEVMELDGKLFLLGHGDGMGNQDRSYNFIKWVFRNRFNQWLFAGVHPNIGFPLAHRWSGNSRRRHSLVDNGYLGDDREGIFQFCLSTQQRRVAAGQRPIDFFLFGHRHTPVVRTVEVRSDEDSAIVAQYINVGNWIENRNFAVFDGSSTVLKDFVVGDGSSITIHQ